VVFAPHPAGLPTPDGSVGVAHPDVALRLVRDGHPVEDEGVLQMRCPALMNCYHNLPDVTARVITADGFYDTSDVFRRDADGFFFFVGRADDMFVCGGENVYPGEIEKLLERHPDVAQAIVVAAPDDIKGQIPVAFIVARSGSHPSASDIKRYTLAEGPAYAHPRFVEFLASLPVSGTHKIDRAALTAEAERLAKQAGRSH